MGLYMVLLHCTKIPLGRRTSVCRVLAPVPTGSWAFKIGKGYQFEVFRFYNLRPCTQWHTHNDDDRFHHKITVHVSERRDMRVCPFTRGKFSWAVSSANSANPALPLPWKYGPWLRGTNAGTLGWRYPLIDKSASTTSLESVTCASPSCCQPLGVLLHRPDLPQLLLPLPRLVHTRRRTQTRLLGIHKRVLIHLVQDEPT